MAMQIILVAVLSVLIVLPSTVLIAVANIRDILNDDLKQRTTRSLESNFELVRSQLQRVEGILKLFAEDERLVQLLEAGMGAGSAETLSEQFDEYMHLASIIENIGVQDGSCSVVLGDSHYTGEAIGNFFESDYCRGTGTGSASYISGVFTSTASHRPAVVMSVPVVGTQKTQIGIISAVIDVGDLNESLSSIQPSQGFSVILDRFGNRLLDSRIAADAAFSASQDSVITAIANLISASQTTEGVFEFDNEDYGQLIVGYETFTDDPGNFIAISAEPRTSSYGLQNKILFILLLAGATMIVALITTLWITVRLSTRRLNQMTVTIDRIAKHNDHPRTLHLFQNPMGYEDEVSTLGKSFNRMIEHIKDSQQKLQEAKAKSDAILLGIGDGVLAIDTNENIIMFNRAAEQISGYRSQDVLNQPYKKFIRFVQHDTSIVVDGFVRKALSGSLAVMPEGIELIRRDGSRVPVADSSGPVVNAADEVIGAVVVFRDVTHEREVDRLKTEFVSVASHQLRTPLTAIRWNLEDVQSQELGPLLPAQQDSIHQATESATRMIGLVNELLDVSRLESGRLSVHPKPTDIHQLVKDVIQEQCATAAANDCVIAYHEPKIQLEPINVDPVLIRQVAMNLVSNAVKYSLGVGKPAKVEVKLSRDGEHYYRVEVKDNGMGIGEKEQERIFQRFFRADAAVKKQTEGSGLGLYIAKLIMEASGGMISFSSKEGQGSTFWFLLPIAGSQERVGGKSLASAG